MTAVCRLKTLSVCRFKTSPCVLAPRPHAEKHVRVLPAYTGTFWTYTRKAFWLHSHGHYVCTIGTLLTILDLGWHVHEQMLREIRYWPEATRIRSDKPQLSRASIVSVSWLDLPRTRDLLLLFWVCPPNCLAQTTVDYCASNNVVYTDGKAPRAHREGFCFFTSGGSCPSGKTATDILGSGDMFMDNC